MSRQSQAQQAIGFAIGASATAPVYIIKARQFSNALTAVFDQVMATYGSRDTMYDKNLTGFSSSEMSLTLPLDDRICPILLGCSGKTTTTGTTPNFVNVIDPYNTNYANVLNIAGNVLTLFFYDATIGMIRQSGKLINETTLTIEADQVNLELDLLGGNQEILTGAALTTAAAGFVITPTSYGVLFRPGDLVVRYSNVVAMTSPTIINADFGLSITISNGVVEEPKTLSAAGLIFPISYLGAFTAGFEITADVLTNDLYTRFLASTETAFEFRFTRGASILTFLFNPTAIETATNAKVADSSDPVKQTITQEVNKNGITHPSLRITANLATDLQTIINI